jgi:xanthine dehydrogenase accessory factor
VDRRTRQAAQQALAAGRSAVVVEVTEARGSAPRPVGTRMLVFADEAIGTIGGGHLELKALQSARALLAGRDDAPRSEHFPLGPALGQCCGGAVTLGYAPLTAAVLAQWHEPTPLLHLQLYGAGHVGRAIATLLSTLDVTVDWIDEREHEFPPLTTLGTPWPAHIRQVCVDAAEAEVRDAPPGAFYLVLTHEHDLDLRITEAVLRRGDFGFLGLIGSKSKRQRFIHRFEQRGVAPEAIARMTCPIGVEGIAGKQPEVLALAAVAQLLQAASARRQEDQASASRRSAPRSTTRTV